jgi:hypothetical protein
MNNLDSLKKLANDLPEPYKANALNLLERMGTVIEGIGDKPIPWRRPLLRLVQGTTDRGSIPKGTGIGDILVGENKLEQPVKFIPLRAWGGRQYWNPDPNESNLLCSSPDGKVGYTYGNCQKCPHGVFQKETNRSDCAKTKNIMAITDDLSEVFEVVFSKTNYVVGMEVETLMKKAGVAPYRRKYGIKSKTNAKYKNVENYAVEILDDKNRTTDEALIPFLTELFNIIGGERKEYIDNFYELVNTRQLTQAQQLLEGEGGSQNADVVLDVGEASQEKAESESVSPMAKSYVV